MEREKATLDRCQCLNSDQIQPYHEGIACRGYARIAALPAMTSDGSCRQVSEIRGSYDREERKEASILVKGSAPESFSALIECLPDQCLDRRLICIIN